MRSGSGKTLKTKSPLPALFENILLLVVLNLMMLRTTYIENPHIEQMQTRFFSQFRDCQPVDVNGACWHVLHYGCLFRF